MKLSDLKNKTVVVDLDGVLCTEEKTFERSLAKPLNRNIDKINRLYNLGAYIIIFTARSWAEHKMTVNQLSKLGVQYHTVVCGKPIADLFIDDRSINSLEGVIFD